MIDKKPVFACVEGGGTKFIAAVSGPGGEGFQACTIATTNPADTLAAVIAWLAGRGPFDALGVASFGPLDVDRTSPGWGFITATTKPGWSLTDIAGPLKRAFAVPVGFDTDVNGAALAEARWGASHGDDVSVYLTVGTGIGGGAVIRGGALHGAPHPEMGHVLARRHPDDLDFPGVCPFHGDCFEGLASGPAIAARWGASLSELGADHPAHGIVGWYLGQLAIAVQAMLAPRRMLMGGGVMATPGLIARVQTAAAALGGGYLLPLITAPALGSRAGIMGALALAEDALRDASR